MANQRIREQFLNGVNTVFHTLFNYGIEGEDGVSLFRLFKEELNVYGEQKFRKYKVPVTLISKVSETPNDGHEDIEAQKRVAVFSIPYKSLLDNGISMTKDEISDLRSAMFMFKDVYYSVKKIQGKAFVEDTYMIWEFTCVEEPSIRGLTVVEEPVEPVEPIEPEEEPSDEGEVTE